MADSEEDVLLHALLLQRFPLPESLKTCSFKIQLKYLQKQEEQEYLQRQRQEQEEQEYLQKQFLDALAQKTVNNKSLLQQILKLCKYDPSFKQVVVAHPTSFLEVIVPDSKTDGQAL